MLPAEEMTYYIDNSDVIKIFTSNMQVEKVKEALSILNKEIEIVIVDKINLNEKIGRASCRERV